MLVGGDAVLPVVVRVCAAVTAQTARVAMASTRWRSSAGWVRTWEWSSPKASFAVWKSSSAGHLHPAIRMRVRSVAGRPSGAKHR